MIWGLFGGKSGPARDQDRIWQSSERQLASVCAEAATARRVLVVAHFRSALEALRQRLESQGTRCRPCYDRIEASSLASPVALSAAEGIVLVLASALPAPPKIAPAPGDEMLLLVAGHHFLPAEDDRILRFCEGLPYPTRLRFHDSLDGPVLRLYAGAQLMKTLGQLGLAADESIQHAMVDRSIRSAQEKIASMATGNRAADSPEDWIRLNLPPA